MFAIMAWNDSQNLNIPASLTPICNALALTGLGISFGLNCSAALNPARDVSARIFLYLVGYGTQAFRYS
jgi:glycerol uptake facilitator-like aquaporin